MGHAAIRSGIASWARTSTMTTAPREHSVVAIFASHGGAEAAIKTLHRAGLPSRELSIGVMEPLVALLSGALEGAALGGAAGAMAATLAGFGLPADAVVKYQLEVKAGRFLVLVHGPTGVIERARHLLGTTEATRVTAHVNRSSRRDPAQMLLPARP
jgi:hypothetical protein